MTDVRFRQIPIAVVRGIFVKWHRIIPEVREPTLALGVVCIVTQEDLRVLLIPATEQIDMARAFVGLRLDVGHLITQRVMPEVRVEVAVAQVVRVLDEHAEIGERQDHVPHRAMELHVAQRLGRG